MERSDRTTWITFLAAVALVAGCVTVNIYFPAAQVEKTAEKIVDDVYREKQEAPPKAPGEKPSSLNAPDGPVWLAVLGPATAYADDATSVSNAAIRALKEQIAQRHQQLLPYYQKGNAGIDRDGFVAVRETAGLALPQVAALKRLVDADNAARRQLYEEVARALNLRPEQVPQVRQVFAKQWRDKAQPGWPVQGDDGRWGRK
jgi:uncharacterized protein